MEKAGIITLYYENYNFGGLLQAFALPKVLNGIFKIDAEQIRYSFFVEDKCKDENMQLKKNNKLYRMGIAFFTKITAKRISTRKRKFNRFMEEIPHSEEIYDFQSIGKCSNKYSFLICGGDQIWNICNGIKNLNVFVLKFAPASRVKIAYAPSMAILDMNDESKECMERGLTEFKAISVREKKSIDILENVTDRVVQIVVDPVLLLKKNEWIQELKKPLIKSKYILCYLISDSVMQRKTVDKIAKKNELKIVTFPHILANSVRKCDLFFGDIHDYTSGPREFLGLIQNAEFVITDSFHACVFSMIFEKPFVVFERNKTGEKGNMNSRIYDFLEEYHLENQLVTAEELAEMNEIPQIDFTYAHKHWKKRREESLKYLEDALKDDWNGESES